MRQIDLFQIGVLDKSNEAGTRRVPFLLWEELEAAGFDADVARRRKMEERRAPTEPPLGQMMRMQSCNDIVQEWREV